MYIRRNRRNGQPTPALVGHHEQLERHGQPFVWVPPFGDSLAQMHRGERRLHGIRRPEVQSVLCRTEAPLFTEEHKRDIFYNNAARFLRLSEEESARHHCE